MAQIIHNISTPNDGLGDELRTAFDHQNEMNTDLYSNKVDKVIGKDLSDNNFSDADVTKLAGIEAGAEVNVQADWLQDDNTQDDFIKNKPDQLFASVGYFHISDLATQTTPLNFVAATPLKLTNDGGGVFTSEAQAPYGITKAWNSSLNKLDFTQLSVGDTVLVRTDLAISTTSANQNIKLYIKFGVGTASEYDLLIDSWNEKSAVTFEQFIKDVSFSIDNEDWRDATAEIYILSDDDGSVKVNGWYIPIIRKSVNIIDFNTDPSKVDKVSTAGVERAYIINADGSQGTKATSEFGGTQYSEWFDWSNNSIVTGWSSFIIKKINCKIIDDCLFVNYNINGTSNSTAIKFTLPFVNKEPATKFDSSGYNVNNTAASNFPARVQIPVEVNEVEIVRDLSGAPYVASGAKHVSGGFFMSVYKTSVFNKGIGGNNTSDVIARLADINSLKANLAIVMIGTNDWRIPISGSRRTPAQYKTNLATIVDSLKANGSDVLMLQFPPIVGAESDYVCPFFGQPSGCDSNATAIPFREKIVEIVSEKSTMYLDIHQAFLDIGQPTNLSTSYMQNFANRGYSDGVHPQPIGATFIAEKIADYLNANNLSYDRIVCIGDSITAGDGLTGLNTATGQTYPAQLKNILNS